ncbi:tetratricopeptide repeat protein [Amphritea sp. HPY]|uniref:tetratricopeptide repeat protein n=1 Tax=Amphritea sp. HPY TaxID=3421652 RepID=UPI003D7D60C8
MRLLMKILAPVVGWLAFRMFRSPVFKRSEVKHRMVMKWFRFAADNGSTRALSVYGHLLHFRGEGADNRIQGAIYLERAAQQGDQKAAYQMAKLYEAGYQNFPQSDAKALKYYQQAAKSAHLLALKRLLEIYREGGLGQAASPEQAAYWQAIADHK